MKCRLAVFTAFLFLAACSVQAAGSQNGDAVGLLNARLGMIKCNTDYSSGLIDLMAADVPGAPDMSQYKTKIQSDLSTLQADANAGNRQSFSGDLKNSLQPDMKAVVDQMKSIRQSMKTLNLTSDQKKGLRDGAKSLQDARKTCVAAAKGAYVEKVGGDMQTAIQNWIDHANTVIGKMQNQSYDTGALSAIVSQAQDNLGKLNTAIASGNADTIQQTITDVRGEHLHVWARFYGNRLKLYVGRLQSKDTNGTYTAQLSQASGKIDEALNLAAVGHKYDAGEFETVKGDLKSAQDIVTDTAKSMMTKGKGKGG